MSDDDPVALKALAVASQALAKIEAHEKDCSMKSQAVLDAVNDLKSELRGDIKALYNRWWVVSGSVIALLLMITGVLFMKVSGW